MDESLDFTLSGRLRNIVLAPSAANSLVPLFEAITNSIHAVEDRFGGDNLKSGDIQIAVDRTNDRIDAYRIDDNGEGLTPDNYKSFLTADSTRKAARGGKGVGRLTWLKVFSSVEVESYFADASGTVQRLSFKFVPDDATPIRDRSISDAKPGARIGTSVRMDGMQSTFQAKSPKKKNKVANEIVRHFMSYMVAENAPRFSLYDFDERIILSDYFSDSIHDQRVDKVNCLVSEGHSIDLEIHHLLVSKSLRDIELGYNTVYLIAHGRTVESYCIDAQLGLLCIRQAD